DLLVRTAPAHLSSSRTKVEQILPFRGPVSGGRVSPIHRPPLAELTSMRGAVSSGLHRCCSTVRSGARYGAVAKVVGIGGGVVSGVSNLEGSGVGAPDRRPRHGKLYHEAAGPAARDRDGRLPVR